MKADPIDQITEIVHVWLNRQFYMSYRPNHQFLKKMLHKLITIFGPFGSYGSSGSRATCESVTRARFCSNATKEMVSGRLRFEKSDVVIRLEPDHGGRREVCAAS